MKKDSEKSYSYASTEETIKHENARVKQLLKKLVKFFLFIAILILVMLFVLNKFVFILHVPSESMEPTLNVNEEFLTKVLSDNDEITYGIYGFYSEEEDMMMVKRIVGLPGDEVEFVDGKMFRNGTPVEEDYVLYDSYFTEKFSVPEGHYLMLGDNRADSFDARYWTTQYIPRKDLIGKVIFRVRPFFRMGFVS